jgi:hypothetical protein
MAEDRRCCSGKDEEGPKLEMLRESVVKMSKSIEVKFRRLIERKVHRKVVPIARPGRM